MNSSGGIFVEGTLSARGGAGGRGGTGSSGAPGGEGGTGGEDSLPVDGQPSVGLGGGGGGGGGAGSIELVGSNDECTVLATASVVPTATQRLCAPE